MNLARWIRSRLRSWLERDERRTDYLRTGGVVPATGLRDFVSDTGELVRQQTWRASADWAPDDWRRRNRYDRNVHEWMAERAYLPMPAHFHGDRLDWAYRDMAGRPQ